jgi:hypothetical protein
LLVSCPGHSRLEDALKLTYLYAEKEQWEKFERAAMRWLRRYLGEKEPTLKNFAELVASLEERQLPTRSSYRGA